MSKVKVRFFWENLPYLLYQQCIAIILGDRNSIDATDSENTNDPRTEETEEKPDSDDEGETTLFVTTRITGASIDAGPTRKPCRMYHGVLHSFKRLKIIPSPLSSRV